MKSKIDWVRRSQRVIRMGSELHRMGYQRLRIMPYEHPLAWRLAVAPQDLFFTNGIALPIGQLHERPIYSSASGNEYFDWRDAKQDDARALAEKFLTRFPSVSERGAGRDWGYVGWLSELLGVLAQGDFVPVVEWEYMKGTRINSSSCRSGLRQAGTPGTMAPRTLLQRFLQTSGSSRCRRRSMRNNCPEN